MTQRSMLLLSQLVYLTLFGISVVAGLWQRAEPVLVFGVLTALFPLSLAPRLLQRWVTGWPRQGLQGFFCLLGMFWCFHRLRQVPVDLALAETIAVFGIALSLADAQRQYGLLAVISLILAGYGSLSPGRAVCLPALALYLAVGILLLYHTRLVPLCPPGNRAAIGGSWDFGSLRYRMLHALFFLVCCGIALALCPRPAGGTVGFMPVSFQTGIRVEPPVSFRKWLALAGDAFASDRGRGALDRGDRPRVFAPDALTPVQLPREEATDLNLRVGLGAGGLGKDLLFRVQAPARLYWLARLYDVYDGKTWRSSRTLRHGKDPLDDFSPTTIRYAVQRYTVEKAVSRALCGAFRSVRHDWLPARPDAEAVAAAADISRELNASRGPCGTRLSEIIPALPWQYECWSVVPCLSIVPERPGDKLAAPPTIDESAYLQLAQDVVSPRVRALAAQLARGRDAPLARALHLRDHLRENYTYDINAPSAPANAEPIDYFLFESKTGFCQHFAAALVILARLSGLPARLATGYSPGSFNVLINAFEVHEYHAHAWSQIFIEPHGWLTFDGVAPGELRLENRPALMGSLLDPFGDELSVGLPELAVRPRHVPTHSDRFDGPARGERHRLSRALERVYRDARRRAGGTPPGVSYLAASTVAELKRVVLAAWRRLRTELAEWARGLWRRFLELGRHAVRSFRSNTYRACIRFMFVLAVLLLVLREKDTITRAYGQWRLRQRCERLWRQLQASQGRTPVWIVCACHDVTSELLALARFRRPGNLDLLEFVDWLTAPDPELAGDLKVIFAVFSRHLFGDAEPTRTEAASVMESTSRLREILLRRAGQGRLLRSV